MHAMPWREGTHFELPPTRLCSVCATQVVHLLLLPSSQLAGPVCRCAAHLSPLDKLGSGPICGLPCVVCTGYAGAWQGLQDSSQAHEDEQEEQAQERGPGRSHLHAHASMFTSADMARSGRSR